MPKPRQKSRPTTQLSSAQSKLLSSYALAASAAGVGLLALTHPAEGEVVYTPAHVTLKGGTASLFIDVNGDGLRDYELILSNAREGGFLYVIPWGGLDGVTSNGVEIRRNDFLPLALKPPAPIGSNDKFFGCATCTSIQALALAGTGHVYGYWVSVTNRYLGLKFFVGSNAYYGWARLNVKVDGLIVTAELTGYAYENITNHPIHAGQTSGTFDDPVYGEESSTGPGSTSGKFAEPSRPPATLGRLALGALGIPADGR